LFESRSFYELWLSVFRYRALYRMVVMLSPIETQEGVCD